MFTITCLCGASRQEVEPRPSPVHVMLTSDREEDRHGSGILFVSHYPIERPDQLKLTNLSAYQSGNRFTRFFCTRCGCHVFRKRPSYHSIEAAEALRDMSPLSTAATKGGDTPDAGWPREGISRRATPVGDRASAPFPVPGDNAAPADTPLGEAQIFTGGSGEPGEPGEDRFELATGVIAESPDDYKDVDYVAHPTSDTSDGGLVPWLSMSWLEDRTQIASRARVEPSSPQTSIPAFCHCGRIQLKILRPQDVVPKKGAGYPYSPYSDLMCPFSTTPAPLLENPDDEKWYLRQNNTKYLAGTCACRSCRLVTGFEIQTWAFIPRVAIQISMTLGGSPFSDGYRAPDPESYVTLDFESLHRHPDNLLRSFESSPGTFREFCPCCGATVFWHSSMRPDLIDVSVGLLHASEGARAESLLEWWRGRCSFSEITGMDRTGWAKEWAQGMIAWLEQGMRNSD